MHVWQALYQPSYFTSSAFYFKLSKDCSQSCESSLQATGHCGRSPCHPQPLCPAPVCCDPRQRCPSFASHPSRLFGCLLVSRPCWLLPWACMSTSPYSQLTYSSPITLSAQASRGEHIPSTTSFLPSPPKAPGSPHNSGENALFLQPPPGHQGSIFNPPQYL